MADSIGTQTLTYRQEHFQSLIPRKTASAAAARRASFNVRQHLIKAAVLRAVLLLFFSSFDLAGTNNALLQSVISTCEFFYEKCAFVGRIRSINHKRTQAQQLLFRNQAVRVGHFASISRQLAALHGRLGVECHRELAFKSAQPTPSVA